MIRDYFYLVANSIKPYAFETSKVLALPKGCVFKARFTREWVQSDILSYPEKFIGKPGFYILRNWKEDVLIPIREIRIKSIVSLGDIVVINYILGDYLSYSSDSSCRNDQLSVCNKNLKAGMVELEPVRDKNSSMSPLIFTSNTKVKIENSNSTSHSMFNGITEKWLNTIYAISDIEIFYGMPFVLPLFLDNSNRLISNTSANCIKLQSGREHTIEVVHFVLDKQENNLANERHDSSVTTSYMKHGPYCIDYLIPSKGISVCPASTIATGRYDVLKSTISIDNGIRGNKQLIIEPTIPSFAKDSYDPRISIDINIPFNPTKMLFQFLLAVIFLGMFFSIEFLDFVDKSKFPIMSKFVLISAKPQ